MMLLDKKGPKIPKLETGVKGIVFASLIRLFLSTAVNRKRHKINDSRKKLLDGKLQNSVKYIKIVS